MCWKRLARPTQFVRPTYFLDNLTEQLDTDDAVGEEFVLRMPMPGEVPLQLVAVRDIGRVAAAALLDPTALGGEALEIAGDELTGEQLAAGIGRHLGRPARYEALPLDALGDDDLQAMFRWFVDTPAYAADFARTRAIVPDVLDLEAWLAQR